MISTLTDGLVTIRPVSMADADDLFEAATTSYQQMWRWLPWCHENYTRDESAAWLTKAEQAWADGTEYPFAVIESATGRYLGGTGINMIRPVNRIANLGYWIRSDATRRGYATAATLLAARFCLAELPINRIEILADIENIPSQRVAEKAGAVREGILRSRLFRDGGSHDAVIYSIIRE